MWALTLMLTGQQPVTLQFKTVEKAQDNVRDLLGDPARGFVTLEDDFGRRFFLSSVSISGALLQDLDVALEGDRQMKLAHIKAEQKLQSDPGLRLAQAGQQTPFGPFGFNG